MIRYKISKNMRVLFVGINPSPGTYRRGVPFSNNKTFWYLLNRSGLIDEPESDLRDDARLARIYNSRFNKVYRFGLLNIINRPTANVTQLQSGEEKRGRRRILGAIARYNPPVVCFIGKITYEKFTGRKDARFGWQKDICKSRVFVMHFPLHGKASVRIRELKLITRQGC